jgi:hypothetical protein
MQFEINKDTLFEIKQLINAKNQTAISSML